MQRQEFGVSPDAGFEYLLSYISLLVDVGEEADALGEWLPAVDAALESARFSQVQQLFRLIKMHGLSPIGQAQVELARANWLERLEKNEEAVYSYRQAMRVFRRFGVNGSEALTANSLGLLCQKMGRNAEALIHFRVAARLHRLQQDHKSLGEVLSNMGAIADAQRNWSSAVPYYERAASELRRTNAKRELAGVLNNLGVANEMLGFLDRAESSYRRCLAMLEEIHQADSEAGWRIQGNLAQLHAKLNDIDGAIREHMAALNIASNLGSDLLCVLSYNNLGVLYEELGDKRQAFEHYRKALNHQRELGDRTMQAMLLNNLGSVLTDLGDFEQAHVSFSESIALSADARDPAGKARTLNNLAVLWERQGQLDHAMDTYGQAVEIFSSLGDIRREIITLINLASVAWKKGDDQVGRSAFLKAWRLAERKTFNNELALLYQLRGDLVVARPNGKSIAKRWYERAVETCSTGSIREGLAERLEWLARHPE